MARGIPVLPDSTTGVPDGLVIRGLSPKLQKDAAALRSSLGYSRLGWPQSLVMKMTGSRASMCVGGGSVGLVAMVFHYFNARDLLEGTAHEAFIGVSPAWQGRGIATAIRRHAQDWFRRNGLSGISTRISLLNQASLNSAKSVGFEPVETYFDSALGEERQYLVVRW